MIDWIFDQFNWTRRDILIQLFYGPCLRKMEKMRAGVRHVECIISLPFSQPLLLRDIAV